MAGRHSSLAALNFRQRRIQHRWTQEERFILCCMKRFFSLSSNEMRDIFNNLYKEKIKSEGFQNGLPKSTLATQWEDIRRRRHPDWVTAHEDVSFTHGPTRFAELFEKIRFTSQQLRISLVARAKDIDVTPQERITMNSERRTRVLQQRINTRTNTITTTPDAMENVGSMESQAPVVPVQSRSINLIRSFMLNTTNISPMRSTNVPNLLWRWSNDKSMGINHRSGYIAGAFLNDIGHIPSPEERALEFPTWLEIHVRPRKIPSPFISTSLDPLVPIHRALTRDNNAFISLIDSTELDFKHVFYMQDLMKQYHIYTPGYKGAKEYVVWGSIPRKAIVISARADELLEIANQNADINAALQLEVIQESPNCKQQLFNKLAAKNFESDLTVGMTIGKFLQLLHLQKDYLNDVALALNTSWLFTSCEDKTEFLCGVHRGYQNAEAATITQTTTLPHDPVLFPSQTDPEPNHSARDIQDYTAVNFKTNGDEDSATVDLTIKKEGVPENDQVDQDQQLRQSIDRLSLQDVIEEELPSMARTAATRRISKESRSWALVPESQNLAPDPEDRKPIIQSIETVAATQAGFTFTLQSSPVSGFQEEPTRFITPRYNSPVIRHARNESTDSDRTLGPQTPEKPRFSEERAHIDRVLGMTWAGF